MPRTYQSIVVNAPADLVWAKLRNFHELSFAPQVVTKLERVGDKAGDQIGAQRILNGAIHETLLALDEKNKELRYSIDDGPSPISKGEVERYVGSVRVRPVTEDGASFVEWWSQWDATGDAAVAFCHPIYVSLLRALRDSFAS